VISRRDPGSRVRHPAFVTSGLRAPELGLRPVDWLLHSRGPAVRSLTPSMLSASRKMRGRAPRSFFLPHRRFRAERSGEAIVRRGVWGAAAPGASESEFLRLRHPPY